MLSHRFLLILLSLFSLVLAGCGDSGDYVFTQSPPPASGQTATVQLRSVLEQAAVPSQVVRLRASGIDASGEIRFGPVTVAKAAQVEWDEVPVEVTEFLVEYLDAQLKRSSRAAQVATAGEAGPVGARGSSASSYNTILLAALTQGGRGGDGLGGSSGGQGGDADVSGEDSGTTLPGANGSSIPGP